MNGLRGSVPGGSEFGRRAIFRQDGVLRATSAEDAGRRMNA